MSFLVEFLSISAGLFVILQWSRFNAAFRSLGAYLLFVGLLQATAYWLAVIYGSNMLLYTWSVPFTFFLIFLIFYRLADSAKSRTVYMLIGLLGIITVAYFMWETLTAGRKNWSVLIPHNLAALAYCFVYFSSILIAPKDTPLSRQPEFWLVSSFFFYFAVSCVHWLTSFILDNNGYIKLLDLNTIAVVCFYICCWLAILVAYRKKPDF